MVNAYVNAERGYPQTTTVLNTVSELIVNQCGTDTGSRSRTARRVATGPLYLPARRHLRRSRDRPPKPEAL